MEAEKSLWSCLPITLKYFGRFDLLLISLGFFISIISGYVHSQHFFIIRHIWQLFIDKERSMIKNDLDISMNFDDKLTNSCWIIFQLGLASATFTFLLKVTFMTAAENLCHRMRKKIFRIILNRDLLWFDERKTSALSSNIIQSLEKLNYAFGILMGHVIRNWMMTFLWTFIAFQYDRWLTIPLFSINILYAIITYLFNKVEERLESSMSSYDNANFITQQALGCIRTVQAFNGQKQEEQRYKSALEDCSRIDMQVQLYMGIVTASSYMIANLMQAFNFLLATEYVYWGLGTLQTVLIVGRAARAACSAFGDAIGDFLQFRKSIHESATVFEILGSDLEEKNNSSKVNGINEIQGKLSIKNLSFSYHNRSIEVLKDITFSCEPGEVIAIVGSSGCGKSTLFQLIQRFYEPNQGEILIDDRPINQIEKSDLRSQFGVVGQEPILFNASIIENIRFAKPSATEAEVTVALSLSNALDFVRSLPKGWNTVVGERGAQLSGGQKQRIAIARAIIRDPKILLLDEATSALDSQSEKEVLKALEGISKRRSTLVIAHRLSTVKNAHRIIVINEGIVVESGTHEELLRLEGHYAQLVRTQLLDQMPYIRHSTEDEITFDLKEKEEIFGALEKEDGDHNHIERIKKEAKEEGVLEFSGWEIFKKTLPDWKYMLLGLSVGAFEGLFMPVYQLVEANGLESFVELDPETQRSKGRWAALWMASPALVDPFCTPLEVLGLETAASRLSTRLRTKIYKNLLNQDRKFFDQPRHSSGRLATRLATDAYFMRLAVGFKLSYFIKGILALLVGLIVSLFYCWPMALLMLPIIPILAFTETIWRGVFEADSYEDKKMIEESGRLMTECIENIKTIRSMAIEIVLEERFYQLIEKPHQTNVKKVLAQGMISGLHESLATFIRSIEYTMAGFIIRNQYGNPIDVFRGMSIMDSAGHYFGETFTYLPEYRKARLAAALVFKLEKDSHLKEPPKELQNSKNDFGEIAFENVSFSYPQRPDFEVLRGVSISIKAGEKVAIVGSSGSGKSTITALLQRFYDPNHGAIKIEGNNVLTFPKSQLLAGFGIVSQEPILFDDTIFANIIYGIPRDLISKEKVIEAAQSANIHSFIESLPDGYETRVGNKGSFLSGGQKQRIAIARALVRDPKFLIFDEATSALDAESEKIVQEALDSASFGRTCLIIAHRLSTIKNADKIFVLSNGKIVEEGSHNDLLNLHGAYYNLIKHQKAH